MRLFWLLIGVLTVNDISCDNTIGNSTMKVVNSSCTLTNVTDVSKIKSSCDNEIIYLFFKDSHFHSFPHVFEYFKKLQSVDIQNACIQHIESTTFDEAVHLSTLDMDGSNITTLQNSVFSHANNLTGLEIQNSSIVTVEDHAFQGLWNLKRLDLSFNLILHLKAEIFQPLSQLETLRLTNNKIEIISGDLFQYNMNLKYVYFSSNKIIAMDPNSFIHTKLISLDLGSNRLSQIDLSTMKQLKLLIVNNNKLSKLIVPRTVDELHADNNSISVISTEETNALVKLFLSSNCLNQLQDQLQFGKLTFLDLANNHLEHLNFSDLKNLLKLNELKLTGNKLSEINANDVIPNLPNIKMIELSTKHWSTTYIKQLQDELLVHNIKIFQDRSDISDDHSCGDAEIVTPITPSIEPTRTNTSTEPPNLKNIEKRLEDITRRLIDLEIVKSNGSMDAKKIDDRLKEMDDKMLKSNSDINAMLSTSKTYETLMIIMFVVGMMVLIYNGIVYSRTWLNGMRYRRAQSRDGLFSEQDL